MGPAADIRTRYDRFARVEAAGSSPSYQRLALAVAADEVAVDLIGRAEPAQRQPNLVFGVLRWHGVDVTDATAAVRWLVAHGEALLRELPTRRTQTNEVARCALLLPALAGLPGPLALVEVGASAGLCLRPDRWSYDYGTGRVEVAQPIGALTCAASGAVPVPAQMPDVRWRMGLDLAPLDPRDADAVRWLECLVWPEHAQRLERLRRAVAAAVEDPVEVRRGDLVTDLPALLAAVPARHTVVVVHTAVLTYVPPEQRAAFRAVVRSAGAVRLGAEGPRVLPDVQPSSPPAGAALAITMDERALGWGRPARGVGDLGRRPLTAAAGPAAL